MTATLVMGLVIEQMRNSASVCIGFAASRSIMPWALNHATRPAPHHERDCAGDSLVVNTALHRRADPLQPLGRQPD